MSIRISAEFFDLLYWDGASTKILEGPTFYKNNFLGLKLKNVFNY